MLEVTAKRAPAETAVGRRYRKAAPEVSPGSDL
jgi:hypothetical protein